MEELLQKIVAVAPFFLQSGEFADNMEVAKGGVFLWVKKIKD